MFPEALGSERPVVRVKALKPYHSPLICESPLTVAVLGNFCPKNVKCSFLWIVEILKNQKTKMLSFYKQQMYFSQIVLKKAKITILFFMKNSKNNNIIFIFCLTKLRKEQKWLKPAHLKVHIIWEDHKILRNPPYSCPM